METMTIKEIIKLQKEQGYSLEKLSLYSGVKLDLLRKIFSGEIKCPEKELLRNIEAALTLEQSGAQLLKEPSAYKVQKKHTIEEYCALPDDERVELIDGEFVVMEAPSIRHQMVIPELSYQILDYIKKSKGKCSVFVAPTDVQLDGDEYTIVQPDLLVLCDKNKFTDQRIVGAPDFVVEVLSPSTRVKDAVIKLDKYRNAGVREYWMIDLEKEKVIVYFFEEDVVPVIYGMDQEVPVGIYDGELKINMEELSYVPDREY